MSGRPWMHIDPAQVPADLKEPATDAGWPPEGGLPGRDTGVGAKPLDYADRCARYLPRRGIAYDPERLSIDRLTPRQRRRALKKERHAFPAFPLVRDIDDDWQYQDDDEDPRCTCCEGEIWVECDDPIQCCDPGCDGEMHPDPACGGTGLCEHQVIF